MDAFPEKVNRHAKIDGTTEGRKKMPIDFKEFFLTKNHWQLTINDLERFGSRRRVKMQNTGNG